MEENTKPKPAPKGKERRHIQDAAPRKTVKYQGLINGELAPLSPPKVFDDNSPVKKLFKEAHKIVKMGMENEYALHEKDNSLQNSNETIENLRKNILHLQMEYEKLDQNFQRELSYRSDLVKRVDATKELVESVVQNSNILARSLKQLEEDKLKIAEFYELIYQNQKEVETKHTKTEKFVKEQNEFLKIKLDEVKSFQSKINTQHSEIVAQLNTKLFQTNEKLKNTTEEKENLEKKIKIFEETSSTMQSALEQQQKLNILHQESVTRITKSLKNLKIQKIKMKKLLNHNKQKMMAVVSKNKIFKNNLNKMEALCNENSNIREKLQIKNDEWDEKFKMHLEDDAAERQKWEQQLQDINNKLTQKELEMQELNQNNFSLAQKLTELRQILEEKQTECNQIQDRFVEMQQENHKLIENIEKLKEENKINLKLISELKTKSNTTDANLNSQINLYKAEVEKLKRTIKGLEGQVLDLEEKLKMERKEKEKMEADFDCVLERKVKELSGKVAELEGLLKEKMVVIQNLESEKTQTAANGKANQDKLQRELHFEKMKNQELSESFRTTKEGYDGLMKQLEQAKKQNLDLEEKLTVFEAKNKKLLEKQLDLEKNVGDLEKEIELERKSNVVLEEKQRNAVRELSKLQKTEEENVALKTSTAELRGRLEATEARLEAYKVVVKKLETEKVEAKNSHAEEITKLTTELTKMRESVKKESKTWLETPQKNTERTMDSVLTSEKRKEFSFSPKPNTKENQENERWNELTTPPGKKFLSTPRRVFNLTPQTTFRNLTPVQKKGDPYDFDSDSSVERFDQNKALKVFTRQKKDTNKKSKTKK